jgi:hypothetical protein
VKLNKMNVRAKDINSRFVFLRFNPGCRVRARHDKRERQVGNSRSDGGGGWEERIKISPLDKGGWGI